MHRYDISMPIGPGMPVFPGDPLVGLAPTHALSRGDPYNVSALSLGTHAGTHLDPPSHFLADGAAIDAIDLDAVNGPCVVVQIPPTAPSIGASAFREIPAGTERVLFRTSNSSRWERDLAFFPDYIALDPSGAEAAIAHRLRMVGVDSLSIERGAPGEFPVHRRLLAEPVLILEGLLLGGVLPGRYDLECLPLRIRGGDGGPARALLRGP